MSTLRIAQFSGMIPRLSARALPDTAAQTATNAKLFSTELRSWGKPKFVGLASQRNAVDAYRVVGDDDVERIVSFNTPTKLVRSALLNDAFDRVYFAGNRGPFITTVPDIAAGIEPQRLGVPFPVVPGFAIVPAAATDRIETRVYVVTFVTKYGEESAPSSPVSDAGAVVGGWVLNGLDTTVNAWSTHPNIKKLRLYRTLSSNTGTDFRRVTEFDVADLPPTFVDSVPGTSIAAAPVMNTVGWTPPPLGLRGIVSVSGGFLAGHTDDTVYFSVPYQPHAWPQDFQFGIAGKIVGLGAFGNTVIVCTDAWPTAIVGNNPATLAFIKGDRSLPCLSERGIVSSSSAVMYPSTDGLVGISAEGAFVLTTGFITRNEWQELEPESMESALYQDRYLTFTSAGRGVLIDFTNESGTLTGVSLGGITGVASDSRTGNALVLAADRVSEWDGIGEEPMTYRWQSKKFIVPKPLNFAAIQVRADYLGDSPLPKFVAPAPSGYAFGRAVGGMGGPLGGPLDAVSDLARTGGVGVAVVADGVTREWRVLHDDDAHRLRSGYKATIWEVVVMGTLSVFSVTLASTAAELEGAQ